jgi:hypothetical protein
VEGEKQKERGKKGGGKNKNGEEEKSHIVLNNKDGSK